MDDEQLFNIPLDAPLDCSAENHLVPAQSPMFIENPQQLQRDILQNSITYESDGVYAGHYRYRLSAEGEIVTTPPFKGNARPSFVYGPSYENKTYRYFTVRWPDGEELAFGPGGSWNREAGTSAIVNRVGDEYIVDVTTGMGVSFQVTVGLDGRLISSTPHDNYAISTSYSSGVFNLTVSRVTNPDDYVRFLRPGFQNDLKWVVQNFSTGAVGSDQLYNVNYAGAVKGSMNFAVQDGVSEIILPPQLMLEYINDGCVITNPGTVDERITLHVKNTDKKDVKIDLGQMFKQIYSIQYVSFGPTSVDTTNPMAFKTSVKLVNKGEIPQSYARVTYTGYFIGHETYKLQDIYIEDEKLKVNFYIYSNLSIDATDEGEHTDHWFLTNEQVPDFRDQYCNDTDPDMLENYGELRPHFLFPVIYAIDRALGVVIFDNFIHFRLTLESQYCSSPGDIQDKYGLHWIEFMSRVFKIYETTSYADFHEADLDENPPNVLFEGWWIIDENNYAFSKGTESEGSAEEAKLKQIVVYVVDGTEYEITYEKVATVKYSVDDVTLEITDEFDDESGNVPQEVKDVFDGAGTEDDKCRIHFIGETKVEMDYIGSVLNNFDENIHVDIETPIVLATGPAILIWGYKLKFMPYNWMEDKEFYGLHILELGPTYNQSEKVNRSRQWKEVTAKVDLDTICLPIKSAWEIFLIDDPAADPPVRVATSTSDDWDSEMVEHNYEAYYSYHGMIRPKISVNYEQSVANKQINALATFIKNDYDCTFFSIDMSDVKEETLSLAGARELKGFQVAMEGFNLNLYQASKFKTPTEWQLGSDGSKYVVLQTGLETDKAVLYDAENDEYKQEGLSITIARDNKYKQKYLYDVVNGRDGANTVELIEIDPDPPIFESDPVIVGNSLIYKDFSDPSEHIIVITRLIMDSTIPGSLCGNLALARASGALDDALTIDTVSDAGNVSFIMKVRDLRQIIGNVSASMVMTEGADMLIIKIMLGVADNVGLDWLHDGVYVGADKFSNPVITGDKTTGSLSFTYEGTRYTMTWAGAAFCPNALDLRDNSLNLLRELDLTQDYSLHKNFSQNDSNIDNIWYYTPTQIIVQTTLFMQLWTLSDPADPNSKFELTKQQSISKILDDNDRFYGCSCATGGLLPFFYIIKHDMTVLTCDVATLFATNVSFAKLKLNAAAIKGGSPATSGTLSCYSFGTLGPNDVYNALVEVTATRTGRGCFLGLKCYGMLRQWTLKFGSPTGIGGASIVTGFGSVGIDGTLTGSLVPAACASGNGFSPGGFPIEALTSKKPLSENQTGTAKGYLTGDSIYFVAANMSGFAYAIDANGSVVSFPYTCTSGFDKKKAGEENMPKFNAAVKMMEVDKEIMTLLAISKAWELTGRVSETNGTYAGVLGTGVGVPSISGAIGLGLQAAGMAMLATFGIDIPLPGFRRTASVWGADACACWSNAVFVNNASNDYKIVDYRSSEEYVQPPSADLNDMLFGALGDSLTKNLTPKSKDQQSLEDLATLERQMQSGSISRSDYEASRDSIFANASPELKAKGFTYENWTASTAAGGTTPQLNPNATVEWQKQFATKETEAGADRATNASKAMNNFNKVLEDVNNYSCPTIRVGSQTALTLDKYFSISGNDAVYAGPGFVQVQMVQQVNLSGMCSFGLQWEQDFMSMLIANPLKDFFDLPEALMGIRKWPEGSGSKNYTDMFVDKKFGDKHIYLTYPVDTGGFSPDVFEDDIRCALEPKDEPIGIAKSGVQFNGPSKAQSARVCMTEDSFGVKKGNNKTAHVFGVQYLSSMKIDSPTNFSKGDVTFYSPVRDINGLGGPAARTFTAPNTEEVCVSPDVYLTINGGAVVATSVKDTKIFDGLYSNVLIVGDNKYFASAVGTVAAIKSSQMANNLRLKLTLEDTVSINKTGNNYIKELQIYHGNDRMSNTLFYAQGGVGAESETLTKYQTVPFEDSFKTHSIYPQNQYMGQLAGSVFNTYVPYGECTQFFRGNAANISQYTLSEDPSVFRYALPYCNRVVSYLPSTTAIGTGYQNSVIDGVTSLVSELRNTDSMYKHRSSRLFAINGNMFSFGEEWLTSLKTAMGTSQLQTICPTVGLVYLGSDLKSAYFYSQAIRHLFKFDGSQSIDKLVDVSRFKNWLSAVYDFINMYVVAKARAFNGGTSIIRMHDNNTMGNVYCNPATIGMLDMSDVEIHSLASGLVYQGEERGQVNRFIENEDIMFEQMRVNHMLKWRKYKGDSWDDFDGDRIYEEDSTPEGWFFNPYRLQTSYIGIDNDTDCKFEWIMTFVLTDYLDRLIKDKYIQVNICAQTLTEGGTVTADVTHLYLCKEMFTRRGVSSYYTFRYTSNNGAGNRESLRVWSDEPLSIQNGSLKVAIKTVSQRRFSPQTTSVVDVTGKQRF